MKVLFVTGTGTDVGKTVFTGLFLKHLLLEGVRVIGSKPICSGSRNDAEFLWNLMDRVVPLDQVNPFHYVKAVSPLLAAREEGKQISAGEVVERLEKLGSGFDLLVVEGAGGLLSPLGEGFSSLDLIRELGAEVIVVGKNQLGIINEIRLAALCLKSVGVDQIRVVLMDGGDTDQSREGNAGLLREHGFGCILEVPYFKGFASDGASVEKNLKEFKKVLAGEEKFVNLITSSAKR